MVEVWDGEDGGYEVRKMCVKVREDENEETRRSLR